MHCKTNIRREHLRVSSIGVPFTTYSLLKFRHTTYKFESSRNLRASDVRAETIFIREMHYRLNNWNVDVGIFHLTRGTFSRTVLCVNDCTLRRKRLYTTIQKQIGLFITIYTTITDGATRQMILWFNCVYSLQCNEYTQIHVRIWLCTVKNVVHKIICQNVLTISWTFI